MAKPLDQQPDARRCIGALAVCLLAVLILVPTTRLAAELSARRHFGARSQRKLLLN